MFDNILRIIWAILTASFVGLILYFRKPLKAIGYAFSELDIMKAGPVLLKRRKKEMDKILSSIQPLHLPKELVSKEIMKTSDELILALEKQILNISNLLLLISGVANLPSVDKVIFQRILDIHRYNYNTVFKEEPNSKSIAFANECIHILGLPPIKESQQSKP